MHRQKLAEWQMPEAFAAYASRLLSRVSSLQFFTDSRAGFLRDAWVASKFGVASKPDAIRLGKEWPDFECQRGSEVEDYEITEADIDGRRRGDEYKAGEHSGWRDDPVEDWIRRANEVPGSLERASTSKAAKGYPKSARLVIYLNISEHGIRQKQIKAAIADATAGAREAFEEVWVLWNNTLYLAWHRGERSQTMLQVPPELVSNW